MLLTLFLFINILGVAIGYLSATGNLHDARRKWFKQPKSKGWLVIALSFFWILSMGLYSNLTDINQTKKDSITYAAAEDNKNRIIATITDALAKHGLKYDSTEARIKKVMRDSLKIATITSSDPDLDFCAEEGIEIIKATPDTILLKIKICSVNESSHGINIHLKFATKYHDGSYSISPDTKMLTNEKISSGTFKSNNFTYPCFNKSIEKIYVFLEGHFKNSRGKHYKLKSLAVYDFKLKMFGFPNDNDLNVDEVRKLLKY